MLDILLPDPPPSESQSAFGEVPSAGAVDGYVELCGPLDEGAGDWLIGGWARRGWREQTEGAITLRFADGAMTGSASTCFFGRGDLQDGAVGFLLLLHAATGPHGALRELAIRLSGETLCLAPARAALPSTAAQLREEAQRLTPEGGSRQARAMLRAWIDPPPFTGQDTLTPLDRPVRVQLEAAFRAPPDGLVLLGWLDDPAAVITALHLRCGDRVMPLDDSTRVRLPRRDVADDGAPDRGFLAWLPRLGAPGAAAALQIRFSDGEVAYLPVPDATRSGLAAMQQILGGLHLHSAALSRAMETVVGPALEAVNRERLARRPGVQDLCFGPLPDDARCSVIVPLAGPPDALEWHLALLSEAPHPGIELLFVLDGPALAEAVECRAETCLGRFGLPFRLLLLDRTVGHAACCNIAAKLATGRHLAFLDAAAPPDQPRWLDRLLTALEQDVRNGAVDSHGGCLVMPAELFAALDGFDEAFVLGDDDREDLRRRIRAHGLRCATMPEVTLRLLEHEPVPLWRRNLAVYNAWQLRRRWPDPV